MFKNEQNIQRDIISTPHHMTDSNVLKMDQLLGSGYTPRNTSDLNEGNSAWHECESEENHMHL